MVKTNAPGTLSKGSMLTPTSSNQANKVQAGSPSTLTPVPASPNMTAPPLRPSLHPSKTETKLRGRQSKKVNTGPASWIRSASTSSMRRLRNHANKSQTRSTPHSPSRLASSKNADDKIPSPSSARHSSSVERNTPSKPTNIQMQNNYNTNSKDLPVGESLDDLDEDDIVFDVLPSFEMYNALHRHIPQGNVCLLYTSRCV